MFTEINISLNKISIIQSHFSQTLINIIYYNYCKVYCKFYPKLGFKVYITTITKSHSFNFVNSQFFLRSSFQFHFQ